MSSDHTTVQRQLERARELISQGNLREAEAALTQAQRDLRGVADPSDEADFHWIHADCLYRMGRYQEALDEIEAAIQISRPLNDHSCYAGMKHLNGLILLNLGRSLDAVEEFTEAYVYFRRVDDFESAAVQLNSLAQAHFYSGNLRAASDALERSIQLRAKCCLDTDAHKRNLARIQLVTGDFSKAIDLLGEIQCDEERPQECISTGSLLGIVQLRLYDLESAQNSLRSALALCMENSAARYEAVCYEHLGLIEHYCGHYRKAREYYQKVLDMPEPTASAVAQTLRTLTDVYIAEGKFKKAMSTAKKAEEAILKINERIELGALWRAYGQIHFQKGDRETARDYFAKSIDLLREIGARYELALTYCACGQSESHNTAERRDHLHTARALFIEMAVPRRVEQVDEAIASLVSPNTPVAAKGKSATAAPTVIAVNPQMKKILAYAEQVAVSDLNVLLTGETGTGKDLLARYMHDLSGRQGEFVAVNAAAIPNEMIESELFGYAEGAFTGARKHKPGRFELANNGTFYLNEIADASPQFQAKLLEVLETHQVWRLGETSVRRANFRLIAACNRDLDRLMARNRFRDDLYHRLNEVMIDLPPLRDRTDDIPALVEYFLSNSEAGGRSADKSAEDLERLSAILSVYDYPGNVRQLKAKVRQLVMTSNGDVKKMIRLALKDRSVSERELISRILESTNWNRSRVSWILGVSEGTIRNWIKKHDITRE